MSDHDGPRGRLPEIHARLCRTYGCPVAFFHHHDPLSELVSALLSHRTRNADSGRAFRELKARFPDWAAVRDAPPAAVQDAVRGCTWPELKAPRVQGVLREITARRGGELSLDFLRGMSVPAARAWLEELPGVGPKTSAAVLLFSELRMPAMPVDSHHHRVALRLGLIPPRTTEAKAHALLERLLPDGWGAQEVYDHHEVMMFLGQRVCYHARPRCGACPLLDLCPTGRATAAGSIQQAGESPVTRRQEPPCRPVPPRPSGKGT
jgi:endonuclease-3